MTPIGESEGVADDGLPFLLVAEARTTNEQIEIKGTAIAYEGTVVVRLVDSNGKVLWHGFATASAGAPRRGFFSASVPLVGGAEAILLGPEEMEEGLRASRRHAVRVPLASLGPQWP